MEFTSRDAIKFERMSEEEQSKNPEMKEAYDALRSSIKKPLAGAERNYLDKAVEYYPQVVKLHPDSIRSLAVAIAEELKK